MNVYPLKCRIRASAGVTRVDVYDDIGSDWLGGVNASDFAGQLGGVRGALDVHINSGGGDVFDGLAIAEAIRAHRGTVTTHVDGIAASIASVIAQAGQERVMAPGSMMMIHDAFGAAMGNEAEVAKFAQTLGKVSANLAGVYAARAGGTADAWRSAMRAETWYTADEAVAAGLADRVAGDAAELPAGLDVAAMAPARIAAALRTLPVVAAARHEPMTGTHSHPHPAYGAQGSDAMHAHEHTHDGDAGHSHDHYDPDHDGDDDSTAAGDTDHDYVLPNGKPGPKANSLAGQVRAVMREELIAAGLWNVKKPHGDVPYADPGYLDADGEQVSKSGKEGVARYPIDAAHVQAAWSYINQEDNASQYTAEQLASIKAKVKSAMKQHGHEVGEDSASNLSEDAILAMFTSQLGAGKE